MIENRIKWSAISIRQFNAAIDYVTLDSVQNAEQVKDKVLDKLEKIARLPKTCPPDKYRLNNDGSYRAFSIFHYRISYRIKDENIEILRIRHTSMEPKYY